MNEGRKFKVVEFDEGKEIVKVHDLRIITGGKEPPNLTGNWLKDLEIGSIFYVQNKNDTRDFSLPCFWLYKKVGPNHKVIILRSPTIPNDIPVDPLRFCRLYDHYYTEDTLDPKTALEPKGEKEDLIEGL